MREVSAGSIVAGHRIESLVARGGMGVVYRVTHLSLDRERALKLIAPEQITAAREVIFLAPRQDKATAVARAFGTSAPHEAAAREPPRVAVA